MMDDSPSFKKKNNLELYLNDVYKKECEFKIEQEEVEFIQTGIETLVQDLVDHTLDGIAIELSNIADTHGLQEEMFNKKNLVEVCFPIQGDCSLYRYATENESYVKSVKSTIIKVGSFYDGTKNNFPDEFDFIFPLLSVKTNIPFYIFDLSPYVCKAITAHGESLQYNSLSEEHQVTRKLDFEKYMGRHGPAYKMQFIYSNGFGEQRPIHVDLVPAGKIIDSNTQQWFVQDVRDYVEPKTFREEILSAESCLCVGEKLAFTEIERYFMKNTLSKKHVKVTRILKHLLNGHGDGEKLEEYFKLSYYNFGTYHTSYCIKVLMIYHHEACRNTDMEDVGPCVLQVLEEMSKYEYDDKFPRFTRHIEEVVSSSNFERCVFSVLPYLKSTIRTLQSIQTSEKNYDYDKDKIQSVSGQYLNSCDFTY